MTGPYKALVLYSQNGVPVKSAWVDPDRENVVEILSLSSDDRIPLTLDELDQIFVHVNETRNLPIDPAKEGDHKVRFAQKTLQEINTGTFVEAALGICKLFKHALTTVRDRETARQDALACLRAFTERCEREKQKSSNCSLYVGALSVPKHVQQVSPESPPYALTPTEWSSYPMEFWFSVVNPDGKRFVGTWDGASPNGTAQQWMGAGVGRWVRHDRVSLPTDVSWTETFSVRPGYGKGDNIV